LILERIEGGEMSHDEILEVLRNEVEEFSKFLAGDVYVVKILVDGEEKDVIGGYYGFDYAVACAKEMGEEYVKLHEKVVKVVLKTNIGEWEVKLDDDSITKLEESVALATKAGGFVELYGGSNEPLPGWSWRITHQGVKLAGIMLVESNNIEIKKFRKMMQDESYFNKFTKFMVSVFGINDAHEMFLRSICFKFFNLQSLHSASSFSESLVQHPLPDGT
jgi:hypothetical protein